MVLGRVWQLARSNWPLLVIGVLLLWIVAAPITYMVSFSFRSGSVVNPGAATLSNYATVYLSPLTYSALWNTIIYAGSISIISLSLATFFAWLVERSDMPHRNLVWMIMLLPIAMPGVLASISWVLL